MKIENLKPITVAAITRGPDTDFQHKITPIRFRHPRTGESHSIEEIRQVVSYAEGRSTQFHYNVKSKDGRYFEILFDSATLMWYFVDEHDPFI